MNPHKERLGCEVSVCEAKLCDAEFMAVCALRKNYQWRLATLKLRLAHCESKKARSIIIRQIKRLTGE